VAKPFKEKQWRKDASEPPCITQTAMRGAALRSFIYYLAEVSLDDRNIRQPAGAMRAALFQSWVDADIIMRGGSRWLNFDERQQLSRKMCDALTAYVALSVVFEDRKLYHPIPKLHMAEHMATDYPCNPRATTCYQDEDMVGRVKSIYSSTHGATAVLRTIQRYCVIVGLRWQHEINLMRMG
jgi:hypothetical protein